MSKISDLIAKLCPNGVEYKPLGEVAEICRGVRVVRKELSETGKYEVFQNSLKPLGRYDSFNVKGKTAFVIGAGAAGEIGYSENDFWAADDCYYIDGGEKLMGRYAYYCLTSRQDWLASKVRKASIPRLARDFVRALVIPVPPLEVQREVVEVLDKFALLTAELTAELEKRKKQYEHYRDKLLNFRGGGALTAFNEHCILMRGEYITKKDAASGDIPVILGGQEPAYYINRSNHQGKGIVISRSGASAGFVSYWDEPIFVTDGFIIETDDKLNIRFLYYWLKNLQGKLNGMKKGGGVPHITGENLKSLKIPLPTLEKQAEVVALLDKFDKLCNDLTSGLPAEIAARKKQYEYYRDKLLTFRKAG